MSQHVLTNAKIFVAGFDLSADHNQIGLTYGAEMKDRTVFGMGTRSNLPGLLTIEAEGNGLWDAGLNLVDEALQAQVGLSDQLATLFAAGLTEGTVTDKGFGFLATAGRYVPYDSGKVGEIHAFALSLMARGSPLCRAIPLKDASVTPLTTTGNGTGFQLGLVGSTQKLYAGLHVLDVSGTSPSMTVSIQSDDNGGFSSATTRITFAAATARGAQYATPVPGPIATDDRWRAAWTISGTSPSFKALVWIAIQ